MTEHGPVSVPADGILGGVEQEFELFVGGEKVDFRTIFRRVVARIGGTPFRDRTLAALVDAGYMVACDEAEAEFATAPFPLTGGGPSDLAAEVVRCREHLVATLQAAGVDEVRGYSTHLNVSLQHTGELGVALDVAELVGPALTLLLEGPYSPGLLVRPRPLRLEIGTEYVDQPDLLRAGFVLIAGVVSALASGAGALRAWPRARVREWEVGRMRGGIYLPAGAFGDDIHSAGRNARVALTDGRHLRAGELLKAAVELAIVQLGPSVDPGALRTLRYFARVPGTLPIERRGDVAAVRRRRRLPPSGPARVLAAIAGGRRSGLRPLFVDWHGAAFALPGPDRLVVGAPFASIPSLLDAARRGVLAAVVANLPVAGRLTELAQLGTLGVFRGVDSRRLGDQAFFDLGRGGKKRPDLVVELYRLGDYPARLEQHRRRPYYHERNLDPRQGAEILVHRTHGPLGRRFRATVRFPEEIRVDVGLTVRAYTTPDRSQWVEFSGAPAVSFSSPSEVEIALDSPEPIHAVHLVDIVYDDLMRLHGQAVRASVVVTDPGSGRRVSADIVNLLVYQRDLGDVTCGHAGRQLDADQAHHNAVNGNVHLPVPVTSCLGHGLVAEIELHHNTVHASYGRALQTLADCNGIPLSRIRSDYDSLLFGAGWTSSLDMRLFPYVVAEGPGNATLLERCELVCPDGNRLQFTKEAGGTYRTLNDPDVFVRDPEAALGLVLDEEADGYRLSDRHGYTWRFDAEGRLVEMGDPRTVNGDLPPLAVEHTDESIVLIDSTGRRTVLTLQDGAVSSVADVAGTTTRFSYASPAGSVPVLETIEDALGHVRRYSYDSDTFLMTSKTNPRGFEVELSYQDEQDEAGAWFWGRLAAFVDGDRMFQIYYRDLNGGRPDRSAQTVEIVDGAGVSTFHHLDLDRNAAVDEWVAAPGAGPRRLLALAFRDATKSLTSLEDDWGGVTSFEYEPAHGPGRGASLRLERHPDGTSFEYAYRDDNRVETVTNALGLTTTYAYDSCANIVRVELAGVPVAVDRQRDEVRTLVTTREFDTSGRILWQRDARGFLTTYGYGSPGDAAGCGLPTSEEREVERGGRTARESFAYTATGRVREHRDELRGLTVVCEHDAAGWLGREETSGIDVMGGPGSYVRTYSRNEHHLVTEISDNAGRTERVTFDRHDLEVVRTLRSGATITTLERDGRGNPTAVTDLSGYTKRFAYDEEDRLVETVFPPPVGGNEQHARFTRAYHPAARTIVERHGPRTTTYQLDTARRVGRVDFEDASGNVGAIVQTYAGGPAPHTVERQTTAPNAIHKFTFDRDRLGRLTRVTEDGVNLSGTAAVTRLAYDAAGNICRVAPQEYAADPEGRPEIFHEYDGLDRRTATYDSYGRVVEKTVYLDASRTIEVYRPPPADDALDETGAPVPPLVLLSRTRFDGLGRTIDETTLGQTVAYRHDPAGRLRELVGEDKRVQLAQTFTGMDKPETLTVNRTKFSLNAGGQIMVDRGTVVTRYRYDGLGNVERVDQDGQPSLAFDYDELGRRRREWRAGRLHLETSYDALGRVMSVRDAGGGTHAIEYAEGSRTITATYTRAGTSEVRHYRLDESGWLAHFDSTESPVSLDVTSNPAGRARETKYTRNGTEFGRVSRYYDSAGNLSVKEVGIGYGVETSRQTFDANGRLRVLKTPRSGTFTMKYNDAGLLRFLERDTLSKDETEFRHASNGELDSVLHRVEEAPRGHFGENAVSFDALRHPLSVRTLFTLRRDPSEDHSRSVTNVYTSDGTPFRQTIEDTVDPLGTGVRITRETALDASGSPFLVRESTEIVKHPDRKMVGKVSSIETGMTYRDGDRKLAAVKRTATDFDGVAIGTSSMTMAYDERGDLVGKTVVQTRGTARTVETRYALGFDAFRRLVSADVTQVEDGKAVHLATVRYFNGPDGELLGEERRYHDAAFKAFVEGRADLRSEPSPLFYLHDQGSIEAKVAADGTLFEYRTTAPGGAYPLAVVDDSGATLLPHQDRDGSTVLFTDALGRFHSYLPFHEGEVSGRAEMFAVQGAQHRLGDGALDATWPYYLVRSISPVRFLGDELPVSLFPVDSHDLTSFTDSKASLYAAQALGRLTAAERAWSVLKKLFYLTPFGMWFQVVEGTYDAIQRRYLEFEDLGFSPLVAGLEAVNAGIGDYVGYTDLLEGIVGVDLTTSTNLSTARRWVKGIWGAVSIVMAVVGTALRGVPAVKAVAPLTRAQRVVRGLHAVHTAWEAGHRVLGYGQTAVGLVELVDSELVHPHDPQFTLAENQPRFLRWDFRLGRLVRYAQRTATRQGQFLRIVRDLYIEALRETEHEASPQARGTRVDEIVKRRLRDAYEEYGPHLPGRAALRNRLDRLGVDRKHLTFGASNREHQLSPDGWNSIDIIWTKGKVAVDLTLNIRSYLHPKDRKQHAAFVDYYQGRRYWFGYLAEDRVHP